MNNVQAPESSDSIASFAPALRTSSYTIYVDLPGDPSHLLLLHGYTGAHDRVSRSVAAFVRSLETGRPPKPLHGQWADEEIDPRHTEAPSDSTMAVLTKRGYLTRMTREEEEQYFVSIVEKIHKRELADSVHYVLMPTYDCNLRCGYCFQDHMRTDASYSHLLRAISKPMLDRIFAAMPAIEARHSGFAEHPDAVRQFSFFGGEPFLKANRPMIDYVFEKIRGLRGGTAITAVSNATELDAYEDLLGPDGIASVQITIDGPPERHDARRVYADGSGSFERIASNIDLALARDTFIDLRMNVDRSNIGDLPALARIFIARGWAEHPNFVACVAPIHASNAATNKRETYNSWELSRELVALQASFPEANILNGPDDHLKSRAREVFGGRLDPFKKLRTGFCSAQSTMYVIDAFGDIYACWERTGDKNFRIGYVDDSGPVFNAAQMAIWRGRSVASNPVCRQCRFALNCGGGCAVLAEGVSGNLHSNFCDAYGKRFRNAVAEAYLDHRAGVRRDEARSRMCEA